MNRLIIAVAVSMIFSGQALATENKGNGNGKGNGNAVSRPDNRPPENRPPAHPGKPEKPGKPSGGTQTANQTVGVTTTAGATATGVGIAKGGNATATGGAGGSATGGYSYASIGSMNFSFTSPAGGGTGGGGESSSGGTSGGSTGGPATAYVQHDYSGMPNNTPSLGSTAFSIMNCDGAAGAQFVAPGFGASFNVSVLRMMCEGRANAATHKALGNEDKARLTMKVVDEFACTQNADWAKIARAEGLCKPEEKAVTAAQTNPAFNSN